LVSRSLNSSVGVAVWRAASAPSTVKSSSTMAPFPPGRGRVAQPGKEIMDRQKDAISTAVEAGKDTYKRESRAS